MRVATNACCFSPPVLQGRTAVHCSRRPSRKEGSMDHIPGAVMDLLLEWGGPEAGRKSESKAHKRPP